MLGLLEAAGAVPQGWAIGAGKYAVLLGVNAYGLLLCTAGFLVPLAWQGRRVGEPSGAS